MVNIKKDLHVFLTERRPHGISDDAHDLVPTIRLEDLRELAKKELSKMLEKKENQPTIDFIMEFFCISKEEADEVRPK